MDWIASVLTIASMFFLSRKYFWAPIFTFFVQFWWIAYILHSEQYGLFPCTIVLTFMYGCTIPKWWRER